MLKQHIATSDVDAKYLRLLAEQYPTTQAVCTEIINLQAIIHQPKGTEHFMSDLHGEYEAFCHILNNCSGVIKEKTDSLFQGRMTREERAEFCTLIYYPAQKLEALNLIGKNTPTWYRLTIKRLTELLQLVASKYTRSKVRKSLPPSYGYIIDELLHARPEKSDIQYQYYEELIDTLIELQVCDDFIMDITHLIKYLAVDHLHIVGDIFDRGSRPDEIIDLLMNYHSLDIQWGNHDILWMGAAAGCETCIACVIRNSLSYNNMDVLEKGYGISLRSLLLFAAKSYPDEEPVKASVRAISTMMFKLEGQLIRRNPEFHMENRLILETIDFVNCSVTSCGETYPLKSAYFPTFDSAAPYELTEEEQAIIDELKESFTESKRLRQHMQFLYEKGSMYRIYNNNLLFHGCIPLNENGTFARIQFDGTTYKGRSYLDYVDMMARHAFFSRNNRKALDFMWYLWCGYNSPFAGRIMKTFERTFIEDTAAWEEPENPYFRLCDKKEIAEAILNEFGLTPEGAHIINGHVPVKVKKGETPVKADGKVIVIDGGFCRAYHKKTGIAGYTLIYNSRGLRLMSHQPFTSVKKSLKENRDIESVSSMVELTKTRCMVYDTDIGKELLARIRDLERLFLAYQSGMILQNPAIIK